MAIENAERPAPSGFHGDVSGLSLADVIQLNGNNGFSGCITVQQGAQSGRIFFREGKIVHAEQGSKVGEAAFYEIMAWSSGYFSLAPNIASTSHTIQKSTQFVLMEALRLIDERLAGRGEALPPAVEPAPHRASSTSVTARLRAMPGIQRAVVIGKDGAYVHDGGAGGEALAGQAAYLAVIANRLGACLGAGEVRTIAVRRTTEHMLILATKNHYLGVGIHGVLDFSGTEADIVKLLAAT
jgi:predicted regulator of Ras-like GTPase activity (Roadblock/LC7/MglB family)